MAETPPRETYTVEIAGLRRDLPLFEVASGVRIAIVNILGDSELVDAAAAELAERVAGLDAQVLVTAEAKSIPLCYAVADALDLPWVVLRKNYKSYMGQAVSAETVSITTGDKQTLYIDERDVRLVDGARVVLIDDVISTGSTLEGMSAIVNKVGGQVIGRAAIFTEGDKDKWHDVIALGHLPVFTK